MTIRECYEAVGSDYENVLSRLGNEDMVKRFAIKFLKDPNFDELTDALQKADGERAFRAAHTLKGVCLNLGFNRLCEVSAALTEDLRGQDTTGTEAGYEAVKKEYEQLVPAIRKMEEA